MNIGRWKFGYVGAALLSLCGSYFVLGIGLVSAVKVHYRINNTIAKDWDWDAPSEITNPMFFSEVMYFVAFLLWILALYLIIFARDEEGNQPLLSLTSYFAFIPVILGVAFYLCGVSPFDIVEALLPSEFVKELFPFEFVEKLFPSKGGDTSIVHA